MISDGSELLQLVPAIPSVVVGSIVLPILGAVPDGMMVLFSGVGPDAQEQVSVGVGALAGSTIMLLTLPWFLAVLGGRVTLFAGEPQYKKPADAGDDWDKLVPPGSMSLSGTGVGVHETVHLNAKLMMATSMLYLVIQIPATLSENEGLKTQEQSMREHTWSMIGLIGCLFGFFGYLYIMYTGSGDKAQDKAVEAVVEAIKKKNVTLRAVVSDFQHQTEGLEQRLLDKMPQEQVTWLRKILFPFYIAYDSNGDRTIDKEEFRLVLKDLGEAQAGSDDSRLTALFNNADKDGSGKIEFDEFVAACAQWALDPRRDCDYNSERISKRKTVARYLNQEEEEQEDDDEDGDEDVPEDLADLSPEEQQRRILLRSFWQMGLGTLMVLFFSDPMVDILSEIGNRTGVSSFYIAFVLAPLASNASELIAAYNYAQKKTQKSMAISLSTLCGAGCMNNTFCLAIFMFLIYFRGLAWQFTAETISIIVVQIIVGLIVLAKRVQTLLDAIMIFGLYPLSLVLVWVLENKVGLD